MNAKEIANALVYEDCVTDTDANTNTYYFKAVSKEEAVAVINQFYQDDSFDFAGCEICMDENAETKRLEGTYLIPHIYVDGEVMELFPVTVKLENKLERLLLKKIQQD